MAINEVQKGNNPTVSQMADKILAKFVPKLRREAKKNFAPFWGEFKNITAREYLETIGDVE